MMRFDPTQWLVPLAGFVYDWILTREWTRILLGLIPTFLLLLAVGLVMWGKSLDGRELGRWYAELGDAEINRAKGSTSPDEMQAGSSPDQGSASRQLASGSEAGEDEANSQAIQADLASQKISDYAGMLFRRAQMLDPSNRCQFMIAVSMLQQGAVAHAKALLRQLAPADRAGYEPAHAFTAMLLAQELRAPAVKPTQLSLTELLHHIELGRKWENAPFQFWVEASNLYWELGRRTRQAKYQAESLVMLERAAADDPALNLSLAERARLLKQQGLTDSALAKAETHFQQSLAQDPRNSDVRIQLAQVLVLKEAFQPAEDVLIEGMRLEPQSPPAKIKRALSDLWLRQSIKEIDGQLQVDQQKLEAAWGVDASNPRVVEQIALLARVDGAKPSQAMIEALQESLAEGTATVTTHARLSEAYLLRGNYEKALPHLRQVVLQAPQAARYLNNLAYTLPELDPQNLNEALQYAGRAVQAGLNSGDPHTDDYFDTLGTLLSKAGQSAEAIAAFDNAIQLNERLAAQGITEVRLDFRERVAAEYRKLGDVEQADKYEAKIEELRELQRQAKLSEAQLEAESASADLPAESSSAVEPAGNAVGDETQAETRQPDANGPDVP